MIKETEGDMCDKIGSRFQRRDARELSKVVPYDFVDVNNL